MKLLSSTFLWYSLFILVLKFKSAHKNLKTGHSNTDHSVFSCGAVGCSIQGGSIV